MFFKTLLITQENTITKIEEQIKKIEASNLVESHKTYRQLSDKIHEIKRKIDLKKVEIKGKLEKSIRLDKHEYDPNCKYCINNDFVRDATKAKKDLIVDKGESDQLLSTFGDLTADFNKFKWVEKVFETYTDLLTERSKLKDTYGELSRNIIVTTNDLDKINIALTEVSGQLGLYHRNKISVESNELIKTKINAHRGMLVKLDLEFQKCNNLLMDMFGKQKIYANQITILTEVMNNITELENEAASYKFYSTAIGRDGIPYQIICRIVPEIEREINSILIQIVDFTLKIETDGKNIVPYVVYGHGKWPIELTSGYERFVASIAIRVALTNITSLPTCNFIAIDEGMGTLDNEKKALIPPLFAILKNYYDFMMIISHIDEMKDAADKQIEITHDGISSKVRFG